MIAIINYNMGNIQSITNAFQLITEDVIVTNNKHDLKKASAIVLPGVGAFGDGMNNLKKLGLIDTLNEEVIHGEKPFLGICLGMQFLATRGYEYGEHEGLGWIDGMVRQIIPSDTSFKIPHMGWNNVKMTHGSKLFKGINKDPVFYFVHSYCLIPDATARRYVTSTCDHGAEIVSSVQKDNIFGVQFHPEKSQGTGLKLLNNFLEYVKKNAEIQTNSDPSVSERTNRTEYRV